MTTDPTDVNTREDSITTNLDSLSYYFLELLSPYIGKSNITPSVISSIRAAIDRAATSFATVVDVPRLGPRLAGRPDEGIPPYKIVSITQDAILRDLLDIRMEIGLPYPLNNIDLHLLVK